MLKPGFKGEDLGFCSSQSAVFASGLHLVFCFYQKLFRKQICAELELDSETALVQKASYYR